MRQGNQVLRLKCWLVCQQLLVSCRLELNMELPGAQTAPVGTASAAAAEQVQCTALVVMYDVCWYAIVSLSDWWTCDPCCPSLVIPDSLSWVEYWRETSENKLAGARLVESLTELRVIVFTCIAVEWLVDIHISQVCLCIGWAHPTFS